MENTQNSLPFTEEENKIRKKWFIAIDSVRIHIFKVSLSQMPEVHLSNEHQNYMWSTSKDIETIALMDGAKEALRHYQSRSI